MCLPSERPLYPGHAFTIACEIATLFPSLAVAVSKQPVGGCAAALEHGDVHGAGGNVAVALLALWRLQRGEALEDVLAWADSGWRAQCWAEEHPQDAVPGCEQARRFLAAVDVVAWLQIDNQRDGIGQG